MNKRDFTLYIAQNCFYQNQLKKVDKKIIVLKNDEKMKPILSLHDIHFENDSENLKVKTEDIQKHFEGLNLVEAIYPIHPFEITKPKEYDFKNDLEKWKSVRENVRESVRDSVWESVMESVRDSVWESVRDSVWESVKVELVEEIT